MFCLAIIRVARRASMELIKFRAPVEESIKRSLGIPGNDVIETMAPKSMRRAESNALLDVESLHDAGDTVYSYVQPKRIETFLMILRIALIGSITLACASPKLHPTEKLESSPMP